MIHEGYLFDFPGRAYELRHADLNAWYSATGAALTAFARFVEPTVAEAIVGDIGEPTTIHHLIAGSAEGGSYTRAPDRTTTVDAIDGPTLLRWIAGLTRDGNVPLALVSCADGWYPVSARPGDRIRLLPTNSEVAVEDHRDVPCVRGPSNGVIVPPVAFSIDCATNRLAMHVHWSPWTDRDGIGRTRFEHLCNELATSGWTIARAPTDTDLDWRATLPMATVVRLPSRRAADPAWIELPARRLMVGLTDQDLEQLVEILVAIDRADFATDPSLSVRGYHESKRRDEIRLALAPSAGRHEVSVERCAILKYPVTNAMWRAYMMKTGAPTPTSWPDAGPPPPSDAPVTGISLRDAEAFAAHHGWRLPREAEWELAATGAVNRWFPWGAWDAGGRSLDRGPVPPAVGGVPQLASPFGVEDLLGGTAEFVADRFAPYAATETTELASPAACLRGLAPRCPPCIPARRGLSPDMRFNFARFRCVRDE